MEKEFTEWFEANEKRFAHGQFDEKQIAYSAWLEGKKQALTIPAVVGQSEQLICPHCGKYKRLQGNGVMHQLCECGEQAN